MAERQTNAPNAEEGIVLTVFGIARDRLVTAGIESADGDRPAGRPGDDPAIGGELALLVEDSGERRTEEFSAHEADAVAVRGIEPLELARACDVEHDRDRHAVAGDGRRTEKRRFARADDGRCS